jgi:hypothetical protein
VTYPSSECFVPGEKFSINSVVPGNLKRHFTTKHPSLVYKDITYFRRLMKQNKEQAKFMTSSAREVQKANYSAAALIVIPCGGGLEHLNRSPASRRKRREGNPMPGPLCHWGI